LATEKCTVNTSRARALELTHKLRTIIYNQEKK